MPNIGLRQYFDLYIRKRVICCFKETKETKAIGVINEENEGLISVVSIFQMVIQIYSNAISKIDKVDIEDNSMVVPSQFKAVLSNEKMNFVDVKNRKSKRTSRLEERTQIESTIEELQGKIEKNDEHRAQKLIDIDKHHKLKGSYFKQSTQFRRPKDDQLAIELANI